MLSTNTFEVALLVVLKQGFQDGQRLLSRKYTYKTIGQLVPEVTLLHNEAEALRDAYGAGFEAGAILRRRSTT